MVRFLITGDRGFIGHNIVRLLEAQGHSIYGIDYNTNYGFIPNAELYYLYKLRNKRCVSPTVCYNIVGGHVNVAFEQAQAETVIHLASFPRQKVVNNNPLCASDVMTTGLINLLEHAVKHKIQRFVYISSSMVYGDFVSGVNETAQCNPQGQYAILKYMGEKLVQDYARRTGMEYVIIRPSAVYGENDVEDRVVSKFIVAALRNEVLRVHGANEVLDFTHVDDTALGIAQAALSPNAANKIYNITRSDTTEHSLLDAANLIVNIAGAGSIEVDGRDLNFPSRGNLDIAAARRDFGFNPTIDITHGFQRYYDWYRQHPTLWRSKAV